MYGSAQADKIAAVTMGVIFGAMASATVAQAWCPGPDIVRFSVVWALASVPYAFLTLGIQLPGLVQTLIRAATYVLFPSYRMRLLRHEAGHMLVGHLLGLPCAAVAANSAAAAVQVRAARDRFFALSFLRLGTRATSLDLFSHPRRRRAQFHDAADDAAVRAALRLPEDAAPRARRREARELDALAVVSLAGVMAEIGEFGDAEGGYADLAQLQLLLDCADPPLDDEQQQEKVRWAALQAALILKRHAGALEALVATLAAEEGRARRRRRRRGLRARDRRRVARRRQRGGGRRRRRGFRAAAERVPRLGVRARDRGVRRRRGRRRDQGAARREPAAARPARACSCGGTTRSTSAARTTATRTTRTGRSRSSTRRTCACSAAAVTCAFVLYAGSGGKFAARRRSRRNRSRRGFKCACSGYTWFRAEVRHLRGIRAVKTGIRSGQGAWSAQERPGAMPCPFVFLYI